MLNEQFTCLTPRSQIDGPDFAWRTGDAEGTENGWETADLPHDRR